MVTKNIYQGGLVFSTYLAKIIIGAEVTFIAVGTPPGDVGSADLKYVIDVAKEIR